MTDQPTWTPERALEMLRNLRSPDWEHRIAIDALESAAAEIERLRDEVTQLEGMERQRDAETARADAAEKEVERLRAELAAKQPAVVHIENGRFIGGAGDVVVQGSYEHGIQAAPEQGQAGPSDEEIAGSIKCVWTWGCKRSAHALQLLARRAGVRL